ncbi:31948_t:CDS:1 [Gigaspora margarita]|uniref:31948_t:CDS:1 n=1 Tax=Gigaspora margarita TaxID=4874 RepID=A0ABN7VYP0_GIGMA|nr:31948_t:CDS:1 [Gigaspora margarita]
MRLEKIDFIPIFVELIKNLFANLLVHITDTSLSSPYSRLVKKIDNVVTGSIKFKFAAYAEDLIVNLGSIEDWNTLINLLAKYKMIAYIAVNKEKFKLLSLTKKAIQIALSKEKSFDKLEKNMTIRIFVLK